MKAVRIASAVLVLLLMAVVLNSIYISKTTEKFADTIRDISTENLKNATEQFKKAHEEFKQAEKFISITVSHDDLTNIEESFADIIGASEAGMRVDVITIKSRLEDALRHLGRLSGINFDSII